MDRIDAENLLMDFCYIWEEYINMYRNGVHDENLIKQYIKEKNKILDEMTRYERWMDR